jgi:hypothetical protein
MNTQSKAAFKCTLRACSPAFAHALMTGCLLPWHGLGATVAGHGGETDVSQAV